MKRGFIMKTNTVRYVVTVIIISFFISSIFIFSGCFSREKAYEKKMKENECLELKEKVVELEKQVRELEEELAACKNDYSNLLYYNREKENLEKRVKELEEALNKKGK